MKKVVLLDLDGTIGDTKFGVLSAVKYALAKIKFRELSAAELNEFIGPPIFDALVDAGVDLAKIPHVIDEYRYAYSQPALEVTADNIEWVSPALLNKQQNAVEIGDKIPGMHFARPFEGIVELMNDLRKLADANDWVIITGTSKPELWAREIIENFNIITDFTKVAHENMLQSGKSEDVASDQAHTYLDYEGADQMISIVHTENDGVFGASMDKSRISKSDVLRYALSACKFDQTVDKAILIGDRKHDIEGAHTIGIDVIGCDWGYGLPNELDPADYVVSAPEQVLPLLEEYFV